MRRLLCMVLTGAVMIGCRCRYTGISILLLILIAFVTVIQFVGSKRWVHYE